MITASRLRSCDSRDALFGLLRELGYPVQPVNVVPSEWRGAGIDLDFDSLALAARMPRLDCYVADHVDDDRASRLLKSLHSWNVLTKSVLFARAQKRLSLYDLSPRRELRRLDVDLDAPSPHALDRLNVLALNGASDFARIFDRALDRETLTRQFFDRFRNAVRGTAAQLRAGFPDERRDAIDAEALLILSRILFLYFVQQKGWLNGERRFLADRLDSGAGDELFAGVLLPLFFGALNTPCHQRTATARKLGAIPYLNGGLFEPSSFEQRHAELHLPNELLCRVIDDVFEKFAFSVDESDAAGTHINPEMLGKVFEALMAEDERAESGSFYTPRPIVDVLTERAIVEVLSDGDSQTRETLRARLAGDPTRLPLALAARVDNISVLDPACGSGAFLLSALRVLEQLGGRDRKHIVEHNLFGVDLKPEAVRLCELRLWLAIVAKGEEPQPLPNLDRNILQGNSLLSPIDFLGGARGDVYREWVMALHAQDDLVARYRAAPANERPCLARVLRSTDCRLATALLEKSIHADECELQELSAPQQDLFGRMLPANAARCKELQERIAISRKAQERADEGELDFFSFDVYFAPVLARGGFDAVIGNPPWVRNSRIDTRTRQMLSERYRLFRAAHHGERAAFHQPDLSIAFFERALALARARGVVSLLMPAKMLNAAYAAPLRRAAEMLDIVALADWSDGANRWFDADTFPLGLTIAKRRPSQSTEIFAAGERFVVHTLGETEWMLIPPTVAAVVDRLRREHAPLQEVLGRAPLMGVKTGDNGSFFLDVKRVRGGSLQTSDGFFIPLGAVCRCVRGRDARRWKTAPKQWMLWPPRDGWDKIPKWLERFAGAHRIDIASLRLKSVRAEHLGIKVVWKDLSRGLSAAVLSHSQQVAGRVVPLIPNQTLYLLGAKSLDEARVIAALMNSTVFGALALCTAERAKDSHFRYFGRTIAAIPLPRVPRGGAVWCELVQLARRRDSSEIDKVVAALYGVSPEEHEVLAQFVARRLGFHD
jgi:methylase of polypeptide subunit release factors